VRKLLTSIKSKLSLIVIVVLATTVGGLATTLVQAAIPDSDGVIHACRLNSDGSVRIIDNSSTSCTGSETSLTWDAHATQGTKYGDILASSFANTSFDPYTDLSFRNLPNTNFTNTSFNAANLGHSNLSNSNFTGATLDVGSSYVNFTGSTFSGTDISSANLASSNFTDVDFSNSSLSGTDLEDNTGLNTANFSGVTWSNVYCPDETNSDDHGNTCIGHLTP
jgi:hypothetical protein